MRRVGSEQKDFSQALGALAATATTITGVTFTIAEILAHYM
ncbi:MAG: hypothetical protein STSR0007_08420 [Thermovirga sp.]